MKVVQAYETARFLHSEHYLLGFVNGQAGELTLGVDCSEVGTERGRLTKLRCDIKKACGGMATLQIIEDGVARGYRSLGVDCGGRDGGGKQRGDLVVHEGEERGNDDGDAMVEDGGQLVTKGFAEGGGGLDEDIVALQGSDDDFTLVGPGAVRVAGAGGRRAGVPEGVLAKGLAEGEVDIGYRLVLWPVHSVGRFEDEVADIEAKLVQDRGRQASSQHEACSLPLY